MRGLAEKGQAVPEVIDKVLLVDRFSNDVNVRKYAEDLKKMFKSWEPVTDQGTFFVKLGGAKIELFNALDVLSLGVRLVWLADLQKERADLLTMYMSSMVGDATFDDHERDAAQIVVTEAEQTWIQRADILLSFVLEKSRELLVRVTPEELGRLLLNMPWSAAGKRTTVYVVGSMASSALLGVTIGQYLYGIGDLYNNFIVGQRADDFRRVFRKARLNLQQQARSQIDPSYFESGLAERYRTAYLLDVRVQDIVDSFSSKKIQDIVNTF